MKREKIIYYLMLTGIPVMIALIFRFLFNVDRWEDIWEIMSVSFFFGLPYLTGVITIYLSREESVKSLAFRITFPWVPIFVFFIITLLFSMEGWACWMMILPVFMVLASFGGLTAGYFRMKRSKKINRLHISIALLLPLILSPVEHSIGPGLSHFKVHTSIDIRSSKEIIWSNVTRVREISRKESQETLTRFLGIPSPVKAELDHEGLNGKRKAIFTGGLIFTEVVTAYEHQKFMEFSIEPNTGGIPSTTFDEHVLIGGKYFDVLKGSYKLEELGNGNCKLHLWSDFELKTTFNYYSGLWATWIMNDIQNNILTVIKERSETEANKR